MKFGILFYLKLDYPLKFSVFRIVVNVRLQFLYWLKKLFVFRILLFIPKIFFILSKGEKTSPNDMYSFVTYLFFLEDL